MTPEERNNLALSLLDYVTPLLRRNAAKYRQFVSYDDLCQDAFIHILRLIDAGTPAQELQRYSYNRVRSRIMDKLKYLRRRTHQSLDAPISPQEAEGATWNDLLPDPHRVEPPLILIAEERITELISHVARLPRARAALAQELGATALASL